MTVESRPTEASQHEELLDAKQVARRLRVHRTTVYRLAQQGHLKAMRLGAGEQRPRGFRCLPSDVDEYLREAQIAFPKSLSG
ncbi:helix-turn-helix domain-containing protein [Streptomyces sp. NBC_00470]|uniref:helix-turn-helix domain-containing protein n=1 Tax=Streptomyces sp. NBC_00470 TaxID=2975753 RepID=UPI002F919980